MKFLWLDDPYLVPLYEDDGILAIDKPYGISSHTNDAKEGNEDYLIPGLIEIFEKQRGQKLYVVHRLDQTTTGVFVIAKTPEAAKEYQDYFRNRETKKTYVFVTASRSQVGECETSTPIRHKGDELSASTQFHRLQKTDRFELWQAKPLTGRNHQIRIHGAEMGLPLLGDEKYGGAKYPFLCLHNRRIEFPNGVAIESPMPAYFDKLETLRSTREASALHERDRRERLYKTASPIRLQNGSAVTIDRMGEIEILNDLASKSKSVEGVLENWQVEECGLRFELRRDQGAPTHGLALEHRLTRNWVRMQARGLSVLSLFSSTGGFALAALLGKAEKVVAVDANKSALNWTRKNLELNGFDAGSVQLLCRDALTYLGQCRSKNLKFDLLIADPPVFARTESGVFRIEEKWQDLLAGCRDVMVPGGRLLFSIPSDSIEFSAVSSCLREAAPQADIAIVPSSLDFDLPGEKPKLKTFLIQFR